jgi:hypothetical protein
MEILKHCHEEWLHNAFRLEMDLFDTDYSYLKRFEVPTEVVMKSTYCLLGYTAVRSAESQPTFQWNISPPSLGSKNKPSKIPTWKHVATFRMRYVPPKRRLTFNGLNDAISQNIVLFLSTLHTSPQTVRPFLLVSPKSVPWGSVVTYLSPCCSEMSWYQGEDSQNGNNDLVYL